VVHEKGITMTFNGLDAAQVERLYYLSEELSESIQAIQKVLRHGYESYDPTVDDGPTNRQHLEIELGQTAIAVCMLLEAGDLDEGAMTDATRDKLVNLERWMHHQSEELLDKVKRNM